MSLVLALKQLNECFTIAGGDVPVIRPQNDELIRLTALQKFESSQVSSNQHLNSGQALRDQPSLFSVTSTNNNLRISPTVSRNQTTLPNPVSAVTKALPSMQKLGLDRMSDEQGVVQRYGMIQRMLGALQHIKPPVIDQQPTSSVNSKDGRSDLLPEELSKFASSILPSSRAISGALNNKISQFIA
uniref:Uncharacterized protein n=1 Tax=Angiostrongylus cantonensis TaxID=6313 RepID=A0A0K0DNT5_ANGCA